MRVQLIGQLNQIYLSDVLNKEYLTGDIVMGETYKEMIHEHQIQNSGVINIIC